MRRRLSLALSALLLALAGCGGDGGDEQTMEVTTAADVAQSTTDDPSAGDDSTSKNGVPGADGKNQDDDGSADDGAAADEASPNEDPTTSKKVETKDLGKPDEGDDEAAATETVERYYQALATGDNEFACELLSRKAQKEVGALLAEIPKRARAGEDCASLLDLLYGQVPEEMLADFGEATVTSVDLKGKQDTRAIAYLEIPEQERIAIRLSFDRGAWRLDQVSGGYA